MSVPPPPCRGDGGECRGMGARKGQVTQVTLSPNGEGGMALGVYRILPVLTLQREGPPRLAAVGVWAPPQPSSDDRERGDYMGAPLQPQGAGESRGVLVFIWVASCYLKSGFVSENETAGAAFGG